MRHADGAPNQSVVCLHELIALTPDPAVAEDIAEKLHEDDARREEDKWSA
jgi:hypothetical protein